MAIDGIIRTHESIKEIRARLWAEENKSTENKYNLYMDNSKQALNYAIFRWGVPLALPLLLEEDEKDDEKRSEALYAYLKSHSSAEMMSQSLKDHERYGLGKAIGDKACHLFAKWTVSIFHLLSEDAPNWGPYSYEVPFDSNAGRVLWRTGFFLNWAEESDYSKRQVIQKGQGKGGLHYIRVTNIRGMKAQRSIPEDMFERYCVVCCKHLRTHSRKPQSVEIQRIPHAYLLNTDYSVAEFDDGLMQIGTKYCFNHDEPKCLECPIATHCDGYQGRKRLIAGFRT